MAPEPQAETRPQPAKLSKALAAFWFLYFGGLGIFFPYFSLYLRENAGLTGTQVGIVLSTLPLVGLFAQPFWGQVADRTGARSTLLVVLTLCAAIAYASLALAGGFLSLVAVTALLAVFSTAVLPVSVSVTLATLRDAGPHAFGLTRVWGTIGYLVFVAAFPWGLHRAQAHWNLGTRSGSLSEPGLEMMFVVTGAMVFAAALVGPLLPRGGAVALRSEEGDWRVLLHSKPVLRLLLFTFVGYLSLQGPMGLFPVYIRSQGGDMNTVSVMWVLMLLLEVPLIAFSGLGLQRLGERGLLAIGVLAGGIRWIVCSLTGDWRILYPIQLLHGVTVTGLMLGAPLYLEAVLPERLRSTGQGLLAMVGVGCGGILSNILAGWLLEHVGTSAPYLLGGLTALILGSMVTVILPTVPPRHQRTPVPPPIEGMP
jgi:PPP family 3-phenylpropionic acid transporter